MTLALDPDAPRQDDPETLEATLRDLAELGEIIADLAGEPERVRKLLLSLQRQDREILAAVLAELEPGPGRGTL